MDQSQNESALLELCLTSALLLAPTRHILLANAAARDLLDSQDVLSGLNGLICTRRADENRSLDDALSQTLLDAKPQLVVFRSRTGIPIQALALSPAPDGENVLAIATDLSARFRLSVDELRALFGFTAAEARMAHGLASGISATGLADACGLSITTVRSYLRTLLRKSGATSQSRLIATLLRAEPVRSAYPPAR